MLEYYFLISIFVCGQTLGSDFDSPTKISILQNNNCQDYADSKAPFNSTIVIPKEENINPDCENTLVLTCVATYPIYWEYFVNGKNMSAVMEISYARIVEDKTKLVTSTKNWFQSNVTLRGHLESHTGRYTCRKAFDKSDPMSLFFDIKIPGNHVFMDESIDVNLNESATTVDIWCLTSSQSNKVSMSKYINNSKATNPLPSNSYKYDEAQGLFTITSKDRKSLLGTYKCSVDEENKVSTVTIHDSKVLHKRKSVDLMKLRYARYSCSCWTDSVTIPGNYDCDKWNSTISQNTDWKIKEIYENSDTDCMDPLSFDNNLLLPGASVLKVERKTSKDWVQVIVKAHGHYAQAQGNRLGLKFVGNDSNEGIHMRMRPEDPVLDWTNKLGYYRIKWDFLLSLSSPKISHVYIYKPRKFSAEWDISKSEQKNDDKDKNINERNDENDKNINGKNDEKGGNTNTTKGRLETKSSNSTGTVTVHNIFVSMFVICCYITNILLN